MTTSPPARCQVWWASPTPAQAWYPMLSATERDRCSALRSTDDRDRYATARALVRLLLEDITGVPADKLIFDTTCRRCGLDHGKPSLVHPTVTLEFSLAHVGKRIVVALSERLPVGVDVERIPHECDPVVAQLSEHALAASEQAAYRCLHPADRPAALAVWWTRKEALLKATGDGLSVPPAAVIVTGLGSPPEVITAPASWSLGRMHDLRPGGRYVGCMAVLGATSLSVTEHDASPLLSAT